MVIFGIQLIDLCNGMQYKSEIFPLNYWIVMWEMHLQEKLYGRILTIQGKPHHVVQLLLLFHLFFFCLHGKASSNSYPYDGATNFQIQFNSKPWHCLCDFMLCAHELEFISFYWSENRWQRCRQQNEW